MPHLTLVFIACIAVLAICSFTALNILAWRHAFALLHYSQETPALPQPDSLTRLQKAAVLLDGIRIPRPTGSRTPESFDLVYESVRIPASSGVSLGAWYCPVEGSHALVILFHGYAQDKSSLLPEAAAFHAMGMSCLLVDFRGSGESTGCHTTIGVEEGEDVAAAFRYARYRFRDVRRVLFGQSMGSAAILRAIQEDKSVQPDAIVLESVFDSMYQTAVNRFQLLKMPAFLNARLLLFWGGWQFGFNPFQHNPADYARSVACPSLFLQGDIDCRARPQDARRVFEAVPCAAKEYREFTNHGHESSAIRHPLCWRSAMSDFFSKYSLN